VSALDSLIRVNKYKLDERRRQLAELERLVERLRGESLRLEQELTSEQQIAAASRDAGHAYGGYARDIIDRRQKLAASIDDAETQILTAREALAESFREVKRYEITAANRNTRERLTAERKQRIAQDEVAAQIHRRGMAR
jgi:flagellar export protein FliJ